jgi:hypothetical protein
MKKGIIILLIIILLVAGMALAAGYKPKVQSMKIFRSLSRVSRDLSGLPRGIFPIMLGLKSREVAIYQAKLAKMLQEQGSDDNLEIDGIWGPITERISYKLMGWIAVDEGLYHISIKPEEKELIAFAYKDQKTLIAQ